VRMAMPPVAGETTKEPGCGGRLTVTLTNEREDDVPGELAVNTKRNDRPGSMLLGGMVTKYVAFPDEPDAVRVNG